MDHNLSIAAVVILYNPPDNVYEHINSYADFVNKIYVFDNTESDYDVRSRIVSINNLEYYQDFKNEGIAKRLNEAVKFATRDGFEYLLTMDQDTRFTEEGITAYLNCIYQYKTKEEVALYGTNYSSTREVVNRGCLLIEADNLITSGMVVNLTAAKTIGPFDENLFIDSIDHDYVIRAKTSGYKVIQFMNITILHKLGEEVKRASIKTLYLIKKKKIIHSPLRSYYMYRNMLYLENKFKDESIYLAKNLRKIVTGNLLANIFYGRNGVETFKYLLKAKSDFKYGRMGKIKLESKP